MGRLNKLFKSKTEKREDKTPSPTGHGAAYNSGMDSGGEGDRSGGTISMGAASTSSRIVLTRSTAEKERLRHEKHQLRRQQELSSEEIAMRTFQRRISESRESKSYTQRDNRAPGWDYIHWKPYGWHRYDYNPDDYQQRCYALAPYVRSVLISGCEGVHEKRWENLTAGKDGEGLYSRTMSQSRLAGSQASLSNVGRN